MLIGSRAGRGRTRLLKRAAFLASRYPPTPPPIPTAPYRATANCQLPSAPSTGPRPADPFQAVDSRPARQYRKIRSRGGRLHAYLSMILFRSGTESARSRRDRAPRPLERVCGPCPPPPPPTRPTPPPPRRTPIGAHERSWPGSEIERRQGREREREGAGVGRRQARAGSRWGDGSRREGKEVSLEQSRSHAFSLWVKIFIIERKREREKERLAACGMWRGAGGRGIPLPMPSRSAGVRQRTCLHNARGLFLSILLPPASSPSPLTHSLSLSLSLNLWLSRSLSSSRAAHSVMPIHRSESRVAAVAVAPRRFFASLGPSRALGGALFAGVSAGRVVPPSTPAPPRRLVTVRSERAPLGPTDNPINYGRAGRNEGLIASLRRASSPESTYCGPSSGCHVGQVTQLRAEARA
jgi:hypothetical protein